MRDAIAEIVDTLTYPLDRPGSDEYVRLVEKGREAMRLYGCAQFDGFLRPLSVEHMVNEIASKEHLYDNVGGTANCYFCDDDPSLPDWHPIRLMQSETSRSLCRDRIDPEGDMTRLFESDALLMFVKDVTGRDPLYRQDDPMQAILVNIQSEGQGGAWHFDANETTLTLLLRKPAEGGKFEFAPNVRSDDDQNFERVSRVLRGSRESVVTVDAEPGTLVIFAGRHSLHHVSKVAGPVERNVLVLAYASQPGLQNTRRSILEAYGHCHPLHRDESAQQNL